jgi:hypothetical protein
MSKNQKPTERARGSEDPAGGRVSLAGDWLIPGFSRPTAEKEGRAGGGSALVRSYVGGPKTSARPPVSSPIGPRAPNPRGPSYRIKT